MAAIAAADPRIDLDRLEGRIYWHTHASFGLGGAVDGVPLLDRVLAMEKAVGGPPIGIVVFDNLQRFFRGDDPNSQLASRLIMSDLEEVQDTIPGGLLVAHTSKGGAAVLRENMSDGLPPPLEHVVSGHAAITNSADHIAAIVKDPKGGDERSLFAVVDGRSVDNSETVWELPRSGRRTQLLGANGEVLWAPAFEPGPYERRAHRAASGSDDGDGRRSEFLAWLASSGGAWATVKLAEEAGFTARTVRSWLRDDPDWIAVNELIVEKVGKELRFRFAEEGVSA